MTLLSGPYHPESEREALLSALTVFLLLDNTFRRHASDQSASHCVCMRTSSIHTRATDSKVFAVRSRMAAHAFS